MPYSEQTWEEKPYNRCITCKNIGVTCNGPNFLAMTPERLGEWCRLRLSYLKSLDKKWTQSYVEEKSGVSDSTISRIFAGDFGDRKISYLTAVLRVLVNGTWSLYPCVLSRDDELEKLENAKKTAEECERLKGMLEAEKKATAHLLEEGRLKDKLLDERYQFMKRKDNIITGLAIALAACICVILGYFVMT